MILRNLLNIHGKLDWRSQNPDIEITELHFDSRKVQKNSVYIAVRGTSGDGHNYIPNAIAGGAAALVVEDISKVPTAYQGVVIEVLDSRLSLQILSQRIYQSPGEQMTAIAVTGTNGKTSTTYILEHLINSLDGHCGVIGTINHHLGNKIWATDLTTPDPVTLQKRLREFLDLGADSFVIEASSHALAQNRISQGFDVTLFTNLSRDHLDYHATMDEYFLAKAKLFAPEMTKPQKDCFAIINGDDDHGRLMGKKAKSREIYYFGEKENNDFQFQITDTSLDGCRFQLKLPNNRVVAFHSPLIGRHNIYNVVGALGCLYVLGYDLTAAVEPLTQFLGVPGRLQALKSPSGIHAFVDYAHTPDAVEQVLKSLRNEMDEKARLLCVFGCGGDRDKGKRPLMAKAAVAASDHVVVTSDNPRSENPQTIVDEILTGVPARDAVTVELDRAKAIEKAVQMAKPGDVVLVAGKGHEDYQILGDKKTHFSDYEQIQKQFSKG